MRSFLIAGSTNVLFLSFNSPYSRSSQSMFSSLLLLMSGLYLLDLKKFNHFSVRNQFLHRAIHSNLLISPTEGIVKRLSSQIVPAEQSCSSPD
jgi:sulfite exporter TauE/SafE